MCNDKTVYWELFYAQNSRKPNAPRYPSQFAAFVANELATRANSGLVIEFGCGNGRDSEFFANCGFNVVAMDASVSAIENCIASAASSRVTYLRKDVCDATELVLDVLKHSEKDSVIAIYARFFLHAITREEQKQFLQILSEVLPPEALMFFEYRTDGDESDRKEFGAHYRRFQAHKELLSSLSSQGFFIEYEIEGKGLAKYKAEDAVVGRCVVRKT